MIFQPFCLPPCERRAAESTTRLFVRLNGVQEGIDQSWSSTARGTYELAGGMAKSRHRLSRRVFALVGRLGQRSRVRGFTSEFKLTLLIV